MTAKKSFYIYAQTAWQTKRPQKMVEYINLVIPPDMNVANPTQDFALMAKIGAKRTDDGRVVLNGQVEFELQNAATGTRFEFGWLQNIETGQVHWILERKK